MIEKTRVLIADDHEAIRKGVAAFLIHSGRFDVVAEASRGDECVELAKQHRPDVIIMDIVMPGLDGVIVTKLVVTLLKGVRVIAHTGLDGVEHVLNMLNAGATGYVRKDEGWAGLVRGIDTVMEGRVYVSSDVLGWDRQAERASAARGARDPRNLTSRQLEVLRLLAEGKKSREIGEALGIATKTVERHREDIRRRTALKSSIELARLAADLGPPTSAAAR